MCVLYLYSLKIIYVFSSIFTQKYTEGKMISLLKKREKCKEFIQIE